jgi:hypothetical protein
MKYLVILFSLLLVACDESDELDRIKSTDGEYELISSVDAEKIIRIVVLAGNNEVSHIRTGASIYSKYAVGWYSDENVIVLNSSDIGTYAWSIDDGFLERFNNSSVKKFGEELYRNKYE